MKVIRYIFFCCSLVGWSQNDSITNYLDAVVLPDVYHKEKSLGYKQDILSDSVINANPENYTTLLRYNSTIYFKENGFGMVSSPSFRGTNASHTATIWNGININSQLNGQTDFNALNANVFDEVVVRTGGGSIKYGSGAIGGTVHLNNVLSYRDHFDNQAITSFGSFNTIRTAYKMSYGEEDFAANFSIAFNDSDNDYRYLGTSRTNENGSFHNISPNVALSYRLNESSELSGYATYFNGERFLSGTIAASSNDKYFDESSRNLIVYNYKKNQWNTAIKAAVLYERYKYFDDADADTFSFGKAITFLSNADIEYKVNNKLSIQSVSEFTQVNGNGTSIEDEGRNQFSNAFIFSHKPSSKFGYQLKIRKDFNSDFESPFIYALGTAYDVSEKYRLRLNASKNFRIPTFNDLFWDGLGNPDLKPETSYQIEIGNTIYWNGLSLDLSGFYIDSNDLIKWLPQPSGAWRPVNVANVKNYGVEAELVMSKKVKKHFFELKSKYVYTKSIDQETDLQNIYVPEHLFTSNLTYQLNRLSVFYQFLFNGSVYTTTDNLSELDPFDVSNAGMNYILRQSLNSQLIVGMKVNNIYNEIYQNVASRPMPNRNFNFNVNYKF